MIYRSIELRNTGNMNYRSVMHISDEGKFEQAYVTAYADIPASCRMEEFGEDYHDADEVLVWGLYETATERMGWESPMAMITSLNERYKHRQFKAV